MKILIADDNNTDRLILKRILTQSDHEVVVAVDGVEAVALFKQTKPDIVLLDALMPRMDGFDAAIEIKKESGDNLIPIIFLTSLTEASALARCLEVGGDDFLSKPYNQIILKAKLKAFERMKLLYDEVKEQRNEIRIYNEQMIREQNVAKLVFDKIAHNGNLEQSNIQYILSPMSVFNGDLLLCAKAPSGSTHLMIGDFTGHGLPAAIGAMPVAEIFYGMTIKGFSIPDIISEINKRLSDILPIGVFCCATACDINYRDHSVTIWSGGLPDSYILEPGKGIKHTISSKHLPLGVLGVNSFSVKTDVLLFNDNDKLYMSSDGILEAESPQGEAFGEKRLLNILSNDNHKMDTFSTLLTAVSDFCQSEKQTDDITLVEYSFKVSTLDENTESISRSGNIVKSLDWSLEYEFRKQSLKSFDPLPLVLQILMECPGLNQYRGSVFTILSELYSNALDHGVLGLDSKLKRSSDGFVEYYDQRKKRLDNLDSGFVRIKMEHLPNADGGELIIQVLDSGIGFDYSGLGKPSNKLSGRGLPLIDSLCENLEHSENGRCVKAVFRWDHN